MFGVGWGLVGVCPGPALANILNIKSGFYPFLFVLFMILGSYIATGTLDRIASRKTYTDVDSAGKN